MTTRTRIRAVKAVLKDLEKANARLTKLYSDLKDAQAHHKFQCPGSCGTTLQIKNLIYVRRYAYNYDDWYPHSKVFCCPHCGKWFGVSTIPNVGTPQDLDPRVFSAILGWSKGTENEKKAFDTECQRLYGRTLPYPPRAGT